MTGSSKLNGRRRSGRVRAVLTALRHQQPDRQPVDFLATPEIWHRLQEHLGVTRASR